MRKEGTRIAPAALLLFSIGLPNAVSVEGNSGFAAQSESCRKASEAEDSLINNMSKVICRQQYENGRDFADLLRQAADIVGPEASDDGEKKAPKPTAGAEKPPATPPKKHARAQAPDAHKWGRKGFASSDKSYTQVIRNRQPSKRGVRPRVRRAPSVRKQYFIGQQLGDLTRAQRSELKSKYVSLLKRPDVNRVLIEIERREAGALLRIVGNPRHKSRDCRKRIAKLNTSAHPREQGLPCRCFLTTRRHGLSTASGKYQIVYKSWRPIRRLLNLESFSARNQKIAALELMRSSNVRGSNVGDGFVALVRGDVASALRLGTDPWASFPNSRWYGGGSSRLPQTARREDKRTGGGKYAARRSGDNPRRTRVS